MYAIHQQTVGLILRQQFHKKLLQIKVIQAEYIVTVEAFYVII
jgi:hypothetical protein